MKVHYGLIIILSLVSACSPNLPPIPEFPSNDRHIVLLDHTQEIMNSWVQTAFAPDGTPHVIYFDSQNAIMKHAKRGLDNAWEVRPFTEEGINARHVSFAISRKGRLGVGFHNTVDRVLWYLEQRDDQTWLAQNVAQGIEIGFGSELIFDSQNEPHLFYHTTRDTVVHSRRSNGNIWKGRILAKARGTLAGSVGILEREGKVLISFAHRSSNTISLSLTRTSFHGGGNHKTTPILRGPKIGSINRLVTFGDNPAVLMSSPQSPGLLKAKRQKGYWKTSPIARDVGYFSAASSAEQVAILYEETSLPAEQAGYVHLLKWRDTQWSLIKIDADGPSSRHLDVAISPDGKVLAAYESLKSRSLKLYDETNETPVKVRLLPRL